MVIGFFINIWNIKYRRYCLIGNKNRGLLIIYLNYEEILFYFKYRLYLGIVIVNIFFGYYESCMIKVLWWNIKIFCIFLNKNVKI